MFNAWLWWYVDGSAGREEANRVAAEFFTGYLIEKSLAVDNIFVFLMLFTAFGVPAVYQRRVLVLGRDRGDRAARHHDPDRRVAAREVPLAAVRLRRSSCWSPASRCCSTPRTQPDLEKNPVLKWLRGHLRITGEYHGEQFSVMRDGVRWFTPLFVVMAMIAITDVIFAVDSIPAIFAVTLDPFIVLTSNVFAILGLRAMYFMLADLADRFHLLKYGLAFILVFIGIKMLLLDVYKIPIGFALAVVFAVLAISMVGSLYITRPGAKRRREDPRNSGAQRRVAGEEQHGGEDQRAAGELHGGDALVEHDRGERDRDHGLDRRQRRGLRRADAREAREEQRDGEHRGDDRDRGHRGPARRRSPATAGRWTAATPTNTTAALGGDHRGQRERRHARGEPHADDDVDRVDHRGRDAERDPQRQAREVARAAAERGRDREREPGEREGQRERASRGVMRSCRNQRGEQGDQRGMQVEQQRDQPGRRELQRREERRGLSRVARRPHQRRDGEVAAARPRCRRSPARARRGSRGDAEAKREQRPGVDAVRIGEAREDRHRAERDGGSDDEQQPRRAPALRRSRRHAEGRGRCALFGRKALQTASCVSTYGPPIRSMQ